MNFIMMKRLALVTLSIMIILCFTGVSFADMESDKIIIDLQSDGSAKVSYGYEICSVDYMLINDRLLVGRSQHSDLLYLLHKASKMSGHIYDLELKHHADSVFKCYDIIITAYDSNGNISKTLVFDSTTKATVNSVMIGNSYSVGDPPYYLDNNGNYVYYLPLRYIFEQLGFLVEYENRAVIITYKGIIEARSIDFMNAERDNIHICENCGKEEIISVNEALMIVGGIIHPKWVPLRSFHPENAGTVVLKQPYGGKLL